jgi:hypothetical protein
MGARFSGVFGLESEGLVARKIGANLRINRKCMKMLVFDMF